MNKPILTERIIASEALRAEYMQDVINWLADQWSMDRALNDCDAKPPDFGIIWLASDKPMAPHGSTNNHARRKHLSPPVGIPGIHVKNDSKHFVLWGIEDQDVRMKPYFYPDLEKQELFIRGYIAKLSSHSRGSTVDLTLLDMQTGRELDMGSPFDFFGEVSHPDCKAITEEQYNNRMILQRAMVRNGFKPLDCEWWHFTLENEPYPNTYFEFPVASAYLKR